MAERGADDWEGLCHPCKKMGICSTGSVYCRECVQIYCSNCTKLHQVNQVGSGHYLKPYLPHLKTDEKKNEFDIASFKFDQYGKEEKNLQKVKYNYITALSADHDHTKKNYPDEIFCLKHKEVVCKNCKFRRHSLCTDYLPVRRASEVMMENGHYLRDIERLKTCNLRSAAAIKETRNERERLNSTEREILELIQNLKHAVISKAYRLENELLGKIYASHDTSFRQLTKAENVLKRVKDNTDEMLENLKEKTKEGIEASDFKSLMTCHIKSLMFHDMLERLSDYCDLGNLHECLFESEYTIDSITHCLGSFGTLSIDKLNSKVPSILLNTRDKPTNDAIVHMDNDLSKVLGNKSVTCDDINLEIIMDKYSKHEKRVTRWSDPDILKQGIVGIICLDKDDLLALDRTSCSVMLIDRLGEPIASYGFNCLPWAMTLYDENTVAISVSGENKIYLVAVEFKEFVLKKEINCSVEPSAVTGYQDNIFITSYPWSDMAAVYKLSDDGHVLGTLEKEASGKRLFKAPLDIAIDKASKDFYVCDSGLKMIFAFNELLQENFRIDLEYMGHPSALTLDSNGNVFICGKLSNVIFKVTTATKKGSIVFTEDAGLGRPQAICNIPDEGSVCVLCARENEFKILKIH
ncbi:uncharacterized protein LOC134716835 [Mytilus trossulus]|uniref:uncharacterized protein LOC134716835 n=1 Tax=Mytilus trossulus TaxID=6551 RepID=UPI0030065AC8